MEEFESVRAKVYQKCTKNRESTLWEIITRWRGWKNLGSTIVNVYQKCRINKDPRIDPCGDSSVEERVEEF